MKSFYCVLVQGGQLDDSVRTALYLTACEMLKKSKDRLKFTDELAQGVVTTDGKVVNLSSAVRGISFDAVVDCKKGTSIKCRFLMDHKNLIPEEEFYEGLAAWARAQITFNEDEDAGEAWKRADD